MYLNLSSPFLSLNFYIKNLGIPLRSMLSTRPRFLIPVKLNVPILKSSSTLKFSVMDVKYMLEYPSYKICASGQGYIKL